MKPRDSETANVVSWAADVVDNEHMDKKSSKACCVFHKALAFAESDSEESDSDWEGFDDGDGKDGDRVYNGPTKEAVDAAIGGGHLWDGGGK